MAQRKKPWENKATGESQGSNRGDWGNLPGNLRPLADLPGELNPHAMGGIQVLVSVQTPDLADMVKRVWDELNAKLIAAGGQMTVTEDELLRYFATAVYSRVAWVTRTLPADGFKPADMWALPVAFHFIVSAIGEVEQNQIKYVPVWDHQGDGLILPRPEWESVSRRLIALEPFGLRFVKAYEKEVTGVDKVMTLLRVDEPEDTFFYAWVPPHVLETIAAVVLGLNRVQPVNFDAIPLDSLPKYRIRGSWVLRWRHDFARLNEHRDVA